jgi:hypothetical protein
VAVWIHRLGVFHVEGVVLFFDLPQEFPHSYHP